MSNEELPDKIRMMTGPELVVDAGIAFCDSIAEFFGDRRDNFGLLSSISDARRQTLEWPMSYEEQVGYTHSCAASLDMMEFTASEIKNCCDVMRSVLENSHHGEKAFSMIQAAMTASIDRINEELQKKIDFIQSLSDDDDDLIEGMQE